MPRSRRLFSPQFKAQTVIDLLTGVANQAEICRQHQLSPQLVARWKAVALEQLHSLFDEENQQSPAQTRISDYYQGHALPDAEAMAEAMFKAALLDLAGEWPTYGYRRLTAMMRRDGWPVNGKRVRRWMEELRINGAPPQ